MTNAVVHDLFVIGGGINGCGIARDAAGRGYSVFLAEMNDLASGTSSASTKLVHGGLRYLEHYEFRLVREALEEREVLWANAPHIIWPLRFVLPYHRGLRPAWMLRIGLFLYDYMGGRKLLPPTKVLDMRTSATGKPLKPLFTKGFEYSDCWVNDARMVTLVARDAVDRGATLRTRTKVVSARRADGLWQVEIEDIDSGEKQVVAARMIVNAAGPWVEQVLSGTIGQNSSHKVRMVQGSHIVTKRLFEHDRCYIFQNADGRIIFAIPYEDTFTLIGTTDQDFKGDPKAVKITDGEIDYLLSAASEYFARPVTRDDLVWSYSGIRPLYDDGASKAQEATRDYVLKLDGEAGQAPLLNVFGGKITTYRRLAESALAKLKPWFPQATGDWTARVALPGGNFPVDGVGELTENLLAAYSFLSVDWAKRLIRTYGTEAFEVLGTARTAADLGPDFGATLTGAEVNWLIAKEYAHTAQDILWRRTKLGLHMSPKQVAAVDNYVQQARMDAATG